MGWINQSDIVLIGLRDYQDAKADVILKYSADEARNLESYGEFPESVKINETLTSLEATWTMTSSSMTLTPRALAPTRATILTEFSRRHFYFLSRRDGFNLDE